MTLYSTQTALNFLEKLFDCFYPDLTEHLTIIY